MYYIPSVYCASYPKVEYRRTEQLSIVMKRRLLTSWISRPIRQPDELTEMVTLFNPNRKTRHRQPPLIFHFCWKKISSNNSIYADYIRCCSRH